MGYDEGNGNGKRIGYRREGMEESNSQRGNEKKGRIRERKREGR